MTFHDMQPTEEIELRVEDISSSGDGVCRPTVSTGPETPVVFVPGVAPGETLIAEITDRRKNFFKGRLIRLLSPHPSRVTPPCEYFGKCPGCSLQFLSYDAQLGIKAERTTKLLKRALGADFPPPEVIGSPREYGYRTHVSLKCGFEKGKLSVGFTDRASRCILDIAKCLLVPEWAWGSYTKLRELLGSNPSPELADFRLRLFFDHAAKTTYVVAPRGPLRRHRMLPAGLDKVLDQFPSPRVLIREVLGVPLRLHPASFVQANEFLMDSLYEQALKLAEPKATDTFLELYAGSGFFTLALAPIVGKAIALEADRRASDNLSKSAEEIVKKPALKGRREPDIEIAAGKAESLIEDVLRDHKPTLIIANPPRSGLHRAVLDSVTGSRTARKIVMISCDPSTCIRDVLALRDAGYVPEKAVLLDLYPQTAHMETVISLRLNHS